MVSTSSIYEPNDVPFSVSYPTFYVVELVRCSYLLNYGLINHYCVLDSLDVIYF